MGDNTKIEWSDATWNPIVGCTVISEGCRNCYAMGLAGGRMKNHPTRQGLTRENAAGKPVWTGEVRLIEDVLDQPMRWRRPRQIFVGAHTDLFHEMIPDEWLLSIFRVIAQCPQHTFQILTKRPARMKVFMETECFSFSHPLPNVWLGVSAEDQATADERIPLLMATPAAVRFLSVEPLLGPVDLRAIPHSTNTRPCTLDSLSGRFSPLPLDFGAERQWPERVPDSIGSIDWVIVGGESGPNARPMHPDWARQIRDDCERWETPFFFKQWGDWLPGGQLDANGNINLLSFNEDPERFHDWPSLSGFTRRLGKKLAGRFLDGRTHDDMPVVEVRS